MALAWQLADSEGQPLACDAVAATSVSLALQSRASADVPGVTVAFGCTEGASASPVLAPGVYDVVIQLRIADGAAVVNVADQRGVSVAPGMITLLTPVTFTVPASQLVLTFRADLPAAAPPGNCTPSADGGAGITSFTLTLQDLDNGPCEPVTFTRQRGATPMGTYTVNCSSPQVVSCVEADETLISPPLPPGRYKVHVRGKIGSANCWTNDDTIERVGELPEIRSLTLAHQSAAGCSLVPLAPTPPLPGGGP